ncbi:Hypothetical_protein [Hexamita inflata]|uniref:Hypothetical_protein n=1 Tax=Hexamita inflata TaxID=28002 RepID=A0AA86UQJ0_9EUKA|nr:Hypothetical protein HINF_LOCUS48437 [Hexamita inflata]
MNLNHQSAKELFKACMKRLFEDTLLKCRHIDIKKYVEVVYKVTELYLRKCQQVDISQQVDIIDKYDIVTFKVDNRPHPKNSGGQQAIFTCKSVQIANQIAKYFEEQDGEMNDGVNEPVRVFIKQSAKI